jgi:DNA polymerase-3 subunit gamma/tau
MATQSLYRRYRPRKFSEVKGQDHVVRALRDAVVAGREGQAYLFSGPRGTGKTTSARILAKVLNCSNVVDGEPCCECDSCIAVEKGTSYDVHELDAASNNGVEAIRDLIEKASLGTPGRHKVYILDEVHMLSKAAEAALLKTLEEPPPHVVFVLATTDPQKMSDTIRSRTQHLQFHLLPADTLAEHVQWVAADAGYNLSPEAIESALVQGGGSARDTLSALELIASTGGEVDDAVNLDEFIAAMIDHDAGRALTAMAHAVTLGRDPRTVTEELVRHLRNAFLSLMAPELVMLPSDRLDSLSLQAQQVGAAGLVRAIEKLGTTLVDMRSAPDPRVLVEVVLVQLTHQDASSDVEALVARLERLEQKVKSFGEAGPSKPAPGPTDPATGRAVLGGAARRPATDSAATAAPTVATEPQPERTPVAAPHDTTRSAGAESSRDDVNPTTGSEVHSADAADRQRSAADDARPPGAERAVLGSGARRPTPDQPMISSDRNLERSVSQRSGTTSRPGAAGSASAGSTNLGSASSGSVAATQPTGVSVPDAWDQSLKSTITPLMVRALFAAGTFVSGSGERWKFDLPSAAHATRCEPHRATIESQLAVLVGHPVSIEFVTGSARASEESGNTAAAQQEVQRQQEAEGRPATGGSAESVRPKPPANTGSSQRNDEERSHRGPDAPDPSTAAPAKSAPKAASRPAIERAKAAAAASATELEVEAVAAVPVFEPDDEIDLSDLTDAPPESVRTPLDHLTDAFPGSQFITDG